MSERATDHGCRFAASHAMRLIPSNMVASPIIGVASHVIPPYYSGHRLSDPELDCCRCAGGPYDDLDRCVAELKDGGLNAVREVSEKERSG